MLMSGVGHDGVGFVYRAACSRSGWQRKMDKLKRQSCRCPGEGMHGIERLREHEAAAVVGHASFLYPEEPETRVKNSCW